MKNKFYLLISLFFCNISNAQTDTTNWQYQLDNVQTDIFQVKNQLKTIDLKTQNIYRFRNQNFLLGLTLKKAIEEGKLTVYQDKKCQKPMTVKEAKKKMYYVHSLDTIISFHPETFAESARTVENRVDCFPTEETIYELSQSWNFDASIPKVKIEAIHISHYVVAYPPNKGKKNYLFSIKVEDLKNTQSSLTLENSNIIWARFIEYKSSFDNKAIKEKLLSVPYLLDQKVVSAEIDRYPFNKDYLIRKREIKSILLSVDTVITFDATTFEEQMVVIRNELNLDDITSFKIAQEIYFDIKDYTFKNRLLAISPGRRVYNHNGEALYQSFYFWIVYDDDFLKWLD